MAGDAERCGETAPPARRRFLVREGPHGWERWNNFTGDWWLLPFHVHTLAQAKRSAADIYGVDARSVNVAPKDLRAP